MKPTPSHGDIYGISNAFCIGIWLPPAAAIPASTIALWPIIALPIGPATINNITERTSKFLYLSDARKLTEDEAKKIVYYPSCQSIKIGDIWSDSDKEDDPFKNGTLETKQITNIKDGYVEYVRTFINTEVKGSMKCSMLKRVYKLLRRADSK